MKIEDLVKPFAGDHCLLCGGKPFCIGIFVPENSQQWSASSGKSRFIRYCLCEKCKSKTDTPDKVEKVILSELAGGGATHEQS
jgi:hypothetical protein